MEVQQAKEIVVQAGKKLVETGLIARTWGNVSCRISDEEFVITPSGRAYETLTPAEIVTVKIADCSYQGDIKPSSEKGIHAEVYSRRPRINFVIHTHQPYASAVSPLLMDIEDIAPSSAAITGGKVVCAAYGLPGTKKLRKGVAQALDRSEGNAFLLAYHGALCIGEDYDKAFQVANELESVCHEELLHRCSLLTGKEAVGMEDVREYYLSTVLSQRERASSHPSPTPLNNSERRGDSFKLYLEGTGDLPFPQESRCLIVSLNGGADEGEFPREAAVHREIYRRNKEINAIIHTVSPDILAVSRSGQIAVPLLDDFAQIIGISASCRDGADAAGLAKSLKGRYGVLVKGQGALCCGPNRSDAAAALMVMEKNCRALVGTTLYGKVKPINFLETRLMRFVYLTQYSKKANE